MFLNIFEYFGGFFSVNTNIYIKENRTQNEGPFETLLLKKNSTSKFNYTGLTGLVV